MKNQEYHFEAETTFWEPSVIQPTNLEPIVDATCDSTAVPCIQNRYQIRTAGRQDTHVESLHETAWRSAAFTVGAQSPCHFQPLKLL